VNRDPGTREESAAIDTERNCGILLHPTCLPGKFGIGDLGPQAYRFVDFLVATGQTCWQVLPLGHTGYGNSPYNCFSAFGGNPYLISPERIAQAGLLNSSDFDETPPFPPNRVDYPKAIGHKLSLLRKSFRRFKDLSAKKFPDDYYSFTENNAFWLEDYALFAALKYAHDGATWTNWGEDLAQREPDALVDWRNSLSEEVQFWKYVQYQFFRQWSALKAYGHQKGLRLIGDIPVYVAHDSAEVWAHRDLFHLDKQGNPTVVAGVPPDYFTSTGQRWGNPIYRWKVMAARGYKWWIDRFRMNLALVDAVRLDHFRGFEAYWEVPASEPTAINGRWVKGPGIGLFNAVRSVLGDVDMIAEDLGVITPEVDDLRDELGIPGMRILQMAFGSDPKASEYRPHNHIRNCVVYTATHDHNTTIGWLTSEPGSVTTQSAQEIQEERSYALKYVGCEGDEMNWKFIRLALASVARLALYPLQDVLGLGGESRMNLPGSLAGNWEWRFTEDMLGPEIGQKLLELTTVYERRQRGT